VSPPTQDRGSIRLGGEDFRIATIDRHGNPDPTNPPISLNFDGLLEQIIMNVLGCGQSLREPFSMYTSSIFNGRLNWLEIDSLVTALTVRWHARVESYSPKFFVERSSQQQKIVRL
jgi:hypothetical protein